jgi:hypothetical protein
MPEWEQRISFLEEMFPLPDWKSGAEDRDDLPLAPYAFLMQRLVMRIAGKEPPARPIG